MFSSEAAAELALSFRTRENMPAADLPEASGEALGREATFFLSPPSEISDGQSRQENSWFPFYFTETVPLEEQH